MIELELLGVGGDGQSLVLTDADGERYRIPVTDELRAAVRRDRSRLDAVPDARRPLRPGEIQSLLRSGLSAAEIAQEYSLDIAHVRRFEAPVLAEQNFTLSRALEVRVGGDPGGPVLADLVVDRLAARGVDPESLSWSARREAEGPWEICLTFVQGAAEHGAHWTMPNQSTLDAVDQEARWLTETVAPAPAAAVFTALPTGVAETPRAEDLSAREALVDQLNAARGHRLDIDDVLGDDEEEATQDPARDSISARIYSLAHARSQSPARPAPDTDTDAEPPTTSEASTMGPADTATAPSPTAPASLSDDADQALPGLESVPAPEQKPGGDHRKGSRRRSVPSWDEIVFGSRS